MIILQFKIGSASLVRQSVHYVPMIGCTIHDFPFPTGGRYTIKITDIDRKEPVEESIFYGEWL